MQNAEEEEQVRKCRLDINKVHGKKQGAPDSQICMQNAQEEQVGKCRLGTSMKFMATNK
jgi:hypothetical protein